MAYTCSPAPTCFYRAYRLPCPLMRTASECLVKAAEMDQLSDDCPVAVMAAEYEELGVYWRGLARLAACPNEALLADATVNRWLGQHSIH
jgi:hypothetical protein